MTMQRIQGQGLLGVVIIGKHGYTWCRWCEKFVRITGWFAGWHVCLTDAEIALKKARAEGSV